MTAGLILAGGASRRMGQNKALLRLNFNAPTLLEIVAAKVQSVTQELWVVTNQPELYRELPLKASFVADNFKGSGPLAGLEAGLSIANYDYGLMVACDMPFLSEALLRFMTEVPRDGWQALVPLDKNNQPEPLLGIYSREGLPAARAQLQAGIYKMADFLAKIKVKYVSAAEWGVFDPGGESFRNLNTPQDL